MGKFGFFDQNEDWMENTQKKMILRWLLYFRNLYEWFLLNSNAIALHDL